MKAQFLIEMPTPAGVKDEGFALYDFGDQRLKWSAPFPLPALGTRVYITMNNIGWASDRRFLCRGWLPRGNDQGGRAAAVAARPAQARSGEPATCGQARWWKQGIGCELAPR